MNEPVTIIKKNPLAKAELPIVVIVIFYFFLFYSMSGGDSGLMISKLFSTENGIIGLTFAVIGSGVTVILNYFHVSRISLNDHRLTASTRIGIRKVYKMEELEACRIKWYDQKERRFPFFQFNFTGKRKLQIVGHHFKGLKPLILYLRDNLGEKLIEMK